MRTKNLIVLLLISLGVAVLASFFASSRPDGLEWVAGKLGFLSAASGSPAIMPDYSCPFIKNRVVSTIAAAAVGILLVFGLFWLTCFVYRQIFSKT